MRRIPSQGTGLSEGSLVSNATRSPASPLRTLAVVVWPIGPAHNRIDEEIGVDGDVEKVGFLARVRRDWMSRRVGGDRSGHTQGTGNLGAPPHALQDPGSGGGSAASSRAARAPGRTPHGLLEMLRCQDRICDAEHNDCAGSGAGASGRRRRKRRAEGGGGSGACNPASTPYLDNLYCIRRAL